MKLLEQILRDMGADLDKSFIIIKDFGGYFKCVKKVEEYSPEKLVLALNKGKLTIVGTKLNIEKYFQQDLLVRGNVSGVNIE